MCMVGRKKTHGEFITEVKKLVSDEYIVLGDYKGSNTKIELKHMVCGGGFSVTPSHFLSGTRCSRCFKSHKKTTEQFKKEVVNKVGEEYEVLGEYKRNSVPIRMRHKICGSEYETTPNSFVSQGVRCPQCAAKVNGAKKKANSAKRFEEKVEEFASEYKFLESYIDSQTKIKVIHLECSHIYSVSPSNFLCGKRCPKCKKKANDDKKRRTHEEFLKLVQREGNHSYSLLSEYEHAHRKIKVKHEICGYIYEVTPNNFLNGKRCPKCNSSKGERTIRTFLERTRINFEVEFKLRGCKYKLPLPFDFALFYKDNLKCLIEYDGEQHFMAKSFFGGENALIEIQKRDAIKTQYCKDNNIPLIRIPYTEYDRIEEVLTNELGKIGLLKVGALNG